MNIIIERLQIVLAIAAVLLALPICIHFIRWCFVFRAYNPLLSRSFYHEIDEIRSKYPRLIISLGGVIVTLMGTGAIAYGGVIYLSIGVFLAVVGLYVAVGIFSRSSDSAETADRSEELEDELLETALYDPSFSTTTFTSIITRSVVAVVYIAFAVLIVLPAAAYGSLEGWLSALRFFSFALIMAAASALVGGLIGFLFAVPRSQNATNRFLRLQTPSRVMQLPQPDSENSREPLRPFPNTNLEDVSDWLTKILIGVALVSTSKMASALYDLASAFNQAGFQWGQTGIVYAMTLAVCFAIGGFLVSYLFGSFYLRQLVAQEDDTPVLPSALRGAKGQFDTDISSTGE
jgi:hypothetical protein